MRLDARTKSIGGTSPMSRPPRRIRPSGQGLAPRRRRSIAYALWVMVFVAGGIGLPGVVLAHGPTIEISHEALEPTLLNLFVGTTVHFANTVEMPGGHVIVDESGTIESPPLEKPGDGWHYTFEEVGTFEVYVREHPNAKARIVVVPKR